MHLESFSRTARVFLAEFRSEAEKVLMTGASAYATSAQQHTPPNLGSPVISPVLYSDGFFQTGDDSEKNRGRRPVYRLREVIKEPRCRNRTVFGQALRAGSEYLVKIFRPGRPVRWAWCATEGQAADLAHETYRGLTRAAWGLAFPFVAGGKYPAAFRRYLSARPELSRMAHLNEIRIDANAFSVEVINHVIPAGAPYMATTDVNASIAAVRSMEERMQRFLDKRREL